jgi:hypothetical protein
MTAVCVICRTELPAAEMRELPSGSWLCLNATACYRRFDTGRDHDEHEGVLLGRQCDGQLTPVSPQPQPAHASRGSFTLTSPNSVAIRCGRQPFTWHLPLHD